MTYVSHSQFYQKINVSSLFQTSLSILFNRVAEHVIQECVEEKEEEIAEIKAQYEEKNNRLMELENLSLSQRESVTNKERTGGVSREDIIKEVFGYFDKDDKELNTILKSLGIKSKGLKKDEKIFKILITKVQNIFNTD